MKPVHSAALSLSLLALIAALIVLPWSWSQPPPTGGPRQATAATSKTLSRADQSTIRVAVTPAPQKQIELSIDGPYQLRPVGSDKVLSRGQQLATSNVTATSSGFKIGKSECAVTRLEIVPTQSPAV